MCTIEVLGRVDTVTQCVRTLHKVQAQNDTTNLTGYGNNSNNWTGYGNTTEQPAATSYTFRVVQASLLFTVFCASVIGNGIVFWIFFKKPSLRTISNQFVLNLAVSNVGFTLLLMPVSFSSIIAGRWFLGPVMCKAAGLLSITFIASCTFSLVAISLDRYFAIVQPFHYSSKMNHRRTWVIVVCIWIISFLISMPPLLGWNRIVYHQGSGMCSPCWCCPQAAYRAYTFFLVIVCSLLPFGVMLWAYCTIFKQAHKCSARARSNSLSKFSAENQGLQLTNSNERLAMANGAGRRRSSTVSLVMATLCMRNGIANARVNAFFQKEEWRTAKTGLMIMSTFTLCWVPMYVMVSLEGSLSAPPIPEWANFATLMVAFLGCALNPIVYVFRNRVIKHYIRSALSRQQASPTNNNHSQHETNGRLTDANGRATEDDGTLTPRSRSDSTIQRMEV